MRSCVLKNDPQYIVEKDSEQPILDLNITILRAQSSIVTSQIYIYLTVLSMQVVNQRIDLSPLPINAKI